MDAKQTGDGTDETMDVRARRRAELEEMIARIAIGDRLAFAELYDATSAKLFAVALGILGERSRAEDVLHDSFVKVWQAADRYASNGYSPMTWLITIVRNTAIDQRRRRRETTTIESYTETLAAAGPGPEGQAIAASEARRVSQCLETLAEDRGAAIRQVYLEGASYAECAARFGVPLNTMRTWLRRGLAALRECLSA